MTTVLVIVLVPLDVDVQDGTREQEIATDVEDAVQDMIRACPNWRSDAVLKVAGAYDHGPIVTAIR